MRGGSVKFTFIFAGYPGDGGVSAVADEGGGIGGDSNNDNSDDNDGEKKQRMDTQPYTPHQRAASKHRTQPGHGVHALSRSHTKHSQPPCHPKPIYSKRNAQFAGRDRVAAAVDVRLRLHLRAAAVFCSFMRTSKWVPAPARAPGESMGRCRRIQRRPDTRATAAVLLQDARLAQPAAASAAELGDSSNMHTLATVHTGHETLSAI